MKLGTYLSRLFPAPRTIGEMAVATLTMIIFAALVVATLIGLAEWVKPQMRPEKVSARALLIEAKYRNR